MEKALFNLKVSQPLRKTQIVTFLVHSKAVTKAGTEMYKRRNSGEDEVKEGDLRSRNELTDLQS
jgi:hypothetical protein